MIKKEKPKTDKITDSDGNMDKFEALAEQWWDVDGDFAPLHKINPARMAFIRNHLCEFFDRNPSKKRPLKGLSIIDIGCGGGLVCEPLARLGAEVTGIDAGEQSIKVAKVHSNGNDLKIDYQCILPEDVVEQKLSFDVVINMEVIEHVTNPEFFISSCSQLVKPGGVMVCSTLNRTLKSLAFAKFGAEYILRWLPRGTHKWGAFITPSEFTSLLRNQGFTVGDVRGMAYSFFYDEWVLTNNLDVNYLIFAKKESDCGVYESLR